MTKEKINVKAKKNLMEKISNHEIMDVYMEKCAAYKHLAMKKEKGSKIKTFILMLLLLYSEKPNAPKIEITTRSYRLKKLEEKKGLEKEDWILMNKLICSIISNPTIQLKKEENIGSKSTSPGKSPGASEEQSQDGSNAL